MSNLFTVSEHIEKKLNRLLAQLGEGWLVTTRWLTARSYSGSLLSRYVSSGWLRSPAHGVYCRPGSTLSWQSVVFSLQRLEGLPVHVGGRYAMTWRGLDHYLRFGPATVTLFGAAHLPAWANRLGLSERFELRSDAKLGFPALARASLEDAKALRENGLESLPGQLPTCPIVVSMAERAILELLVEAPGRTSIGEADAILQGLAGLRPVLVSRLLHRCRSVKVKRLFLSLAERHGHAWFQHLDLDGVDLGRGKRVLVPGGQLHPKYQITLPADLDEQLG